MWNEVECQPTSAHRELTVPAFQSLWSSDTQPDRPPQPLSHALRSIVWNSLSTEVRDGSNSPAWILFESVQKCEKIMKMVNDFWPSFNTKNGISSSKRVWEKFTENFDCVPEDDMYTVNHKKRDSLFLTITLANLNRFLQFLYHFNRE